LQSLGHFSPAHAGHHDIHQDYVWPFGAGQVQGLIAVCAGNNFACHGTLQSQLQGTHDMILIVHHKNFSLDHERFPPGKSDHVTPTGCGPWLRRSLAGHAHQHGFDNGKG
jgi:hypothetical protein